MYDDTSKNYNACHKFDVAFTLLKKKKIPILIRKLFQKSMTLKWFI